MNWSKHHVFMLVFALVFSVEMYAYSHEEICFKPMILTLIIYSIILALGSYFVGLRFYMPLINRLPKSHNHQNTIALTFDDGPNPAVQSHLLDILDKHQVKANFFLIGSHIEQHLNLAKELHSRGHLLANHSYSHSNLFPLKSGRKVQEEIKKTNKLIESITHQKNTYFRPPFGVTNPIIANAVKGLKMTSVGWSLRSYDTVKKEHELIEKLKNNIKARDIVLMHELESSLHAIDKFIEYAKQEGYRFILLSEIDKG